MDKVLESIQNANHILLNCHVGTDGDSVGGSLSMHHYLKSLGKKVTHISGDDPIPEYLSKLPGADLIEDKGWFDLDLNQFDLFICIDTASLNQISKLNEILIPNKLKTIVIDHHISNSSFGNINVVDKEAISACQVLYYLYKKLEIDITPEMAACLMVGMYTDSGGFKYPLVSDKTFLAAAELSKINPDYTKILFEMENTRKPSDLIFQGLALNNINQFFSGQVAVAIVVNKQLEEKGIANDFPGGAEIANLLKSVIGWDIGISMVEKKPGIFSMSFRTRDVSRFDLTIVTGKLGGGGHKAASGAQVSKSLDETKKLLLESLQSSYPDLGKP